LIYEGYVRCANRHAVNQWVHDQWAQGESKGPVYRN